MHPQHYADAQAGHSRPAHEQAPRPLAGRLVLLGVTGSIAAYKAAELVRALTAAGADVQVADDPHRSRFIGPLTLETLSRRPVMLDPLELLPDQRIGHIVAADTADAILVAPATARWLAAMATGLADDVITATCLASAAPVVVAPGHGRRHVRPSGHARQRGKLRGFGLPHRGAGGRVRWRRARSGRAAWRRCRRIVEAVVDGLGGRPVASARPGAAAAASRSRRPPQDLAGWHVVVTAGGTAEPIDPVRFIGNRSTGQMGVAIAEAALGRGARVTLIHGMTSVPLPDARRSSAPDDRAEMRDAVLAALPAADALIMAAAVADFRPRPARRQARARRRA